VLLGVVGVLVAAPLRRGLLADSAAALRPPAARTAAEQVEN
jgi:hypothetical protein